jgi:hypothetical protein
MSLSADRLLVAKFLEKVRLESQVENGRITVRWILGELGCENGR